MSVIKSNFSNHQIHGTRIGIYTICCCSMYLFIGRMAFSVLREICYNEVSYYYCLSLSYKCYVCYKSNFPIFSYMEQGLAYTQYVAAPCICSLVEWLLVFLERFVIMRSLTFIV